MTVTQQNYASIAATLNRATLQVDLRDGYDLVLEASANYTDWSVFSDPDLADFLSVYFQKLGAYLNTATTTGPPVVIPNPVIIVDNFAPPVTVGPATVVSGSGGSVSGGVIAVVPGVSSPLQPIGPPAPVIGPNDVWVVQDGTAVGGTGGVLVGIVSGPGITPVVTPISSIVPPSPSPSINVNITTPPATLLTTLVEPDTTTDTTIKSKWLQYGLIAVGVAVAIVLAVVLYGKWKK